MPTGHKPSYSIISKAPAAFRYGGARAGSAGYGPESWNGHGPISVRRQTAGPCLRTADGSCPMREIAIAPHCLRRGENDSGERESPRGNAGSRRAAGRIFTGPIRMRPPRAVPCPHPVLTPDRERLWRHPRPRGCPMPMRRSRFGITVLSERCLSMRLRFHRTISTKRYSDATYTLLHFSA